MASVRSSGFEGVVADRRDSIRKPGDRSGDWGKSGRCVPQKRMPFRDCNADDAIRGARAIRAGAAENFTHHMRCDPE